MDEFSLIDALLADELAWPSWLSCPPGDDGAVVTPPADSELVLSTDTLVSGRHFPETLPPELLGWRSLAVNLSDLAAMGAQPAGFLVALVADELTTDWCRQFSSGLRAAAGASGARLVGGNLASGPLSVSVTATGWVPHGGALLRSGARPGDLICVSGTIGAGGQALAAVLAATQSLPALTLDSVPDGWRPYLLPRARWLLGLALRGRATATIDVSDGLLADLAHVCEASGVGATLWQSALPVPEGMDLATAASSGDDYELLFTLPPEADLQALATAGGVRVAEIGRIDAQAGLRWVDGRGELQPLPAEHGWRHFQ